MTEKQLRQQVVDVMRGWVGAVRGDARHKEILRIYNTHQPLARSYTVQVNDAYCATTASAAYIKVGIATYTGTECGVGPWVTIAEKLGIWVENDAHTPKPGDAIIYDWDDSGVGDNGGYPDHVGIVEVVRSDGTFDVIEGNISGGRVGRRTMHVNGKYIRGYICPDFAMIAAKLSPIEDDEEVNMTKSELQKMIDDGVAKAIHSANEATDDKIKKALDDALGPKIGDYTEIPWEGVRAEVGEMVELGVIDGGTSAEVNPSDVNMRLQDIRVLVVAKRYVLKVLADKFKIFGKIINR